MGLLGKGEEDTASARKRASRVQIRLWTSGTLNYYDPIARRRSLPVLAGISRRDER